MAGIAVMAQQILRHCFVTINELNARNSHASHLYESQTYKTNPCANSVSTWCCYLGNRFTGSTSAMTLFHYEQLIRNWEYQARMVDAKNERQVAGWQLYLQYLKAKGEQQGEEFVAVYSVCERRLAIKNSIYLHH